MIPDKNESHKIGQRFDPFKNDKGFGMVPCDFGDYVTAKDYLDLKEELRTYKWEWEQACERDRESQKEINKLKYNK